MRRLALSCGLGLALGLASFAFAAAAPSAEAVRSEAARLAQKQGDADRAILDWVLANSGPLKGDLFAGDLRVAYTVTPAEGWWDRAGEGKLVWHDVPQGQVHLRIFVASRADGRLVPNLIVTASLVDANGNQMPLPVAFGWYPLVNAYGGNISVADGSYRLRVGIAAPSQQGGGQAQITWAEFPAVDIQQDTVTQLPLATATASQKEAELLRPADDALGASLTALWRHSVSGDEKADGDYFIAYALGDSEAAVPLVRPSKRAQADPGGKATRLEVLVLDSRTGRPIPCLAPRATLESDGALYDRGVLDPLRQSWLDLYGHDERLPRRGTFRLRVSVAAPGFRRWGRQSARFAQPAELEFDNLTLSPAAPRRESKAGARKRGTNR